MMIRFEVREDRRLSAAERGDGDSTGGTARNRVTPW